MSLSPMMSQYLALKENYKDTLVFFRLGDFYELFFEDALVASKELDLTLTGRDCGTDEKAPMCGVPFHAADTYLARLIEKGYKVAICEQLSEPKAKSIVERGVVRVLTPGTVTESSILNESKNNYLASIYFKNNVAAISWTDISTGEFNYMIIENQLSTRLNDVLSRIEPSEIICNSDMLAESINLSLVKYGGLCPFTAYDDFKFDYDFAYETLSSQISKQSLTLLKSDKHCVCAAGALISYIKDTQKRALKHINNITLETGNEYMLVDYYARKTLELTSVMHDSKQKCSLLWFINRTKTSMGSRLIKKWIEQPSINSSIINNRLDFVNELVNDDIRFSKFVSILSRISELERPSSRISYGNVTPKDCLSLGNSLKMLPKLKQLLSEGKCAISLDLNENIDDLENLANMLLSAISDKCSNNFKDGGIFNDGYDARLDEYRAMDKSAAQFIAELEVAEKEETGIKNLKISYNRIFGYYIEVLKSQLELVPYRYKRKQTVASGERFITDELKELEIKLLNSQELALRRELELYGILIENLKDYVDSILKSAKSIAYVDCLVSNAIIAKELNWVKPTINDSIKHIYIQEGRHCIVEKLLKNEAFVPNDTFLDQQDSKIMLITGPNMAGKSIYMRQVALITILAHIGSFVPAKAAEISLTDKIFTRVGANDDLSTGRSTFMVEMTEVSNILLNATDNSLILMDEIGRGTSTYDGLSIAWAILEYLCSDLKAKTLFSTHYHELTDLEGILNGIKNYKLTVKEYNNSILFLRKVMRGSANKSFGIEVAGLAGLPQNIIIRSKQLLKELEAADICKNSKKDTDLQFSIFNNNLVNNEIITILKELNIDNITPRNALDILSDLAEKVKTNG